MEICCYYSTHIISLTLEGAGLYISLDMYMLANFAQRFDYSIYCSGYAFSVFRITPEDGGPLPDYYYIHFKVAVPSDRQGEGMGMGGWSDARRTEGGG